MTNTITAERLLQSQIDKNPLAIVDSPPGAGKTWLVERVCTLSYHILNERCMVVTFTNQQAIDVSRRIAENFPQNRVYLLVKKDLPIPESVSGLQNLVIINNPTNIPQGPCIVVSNATKWSWVSSCHRFDLMIIDEAYQIADMSFHLIANLADRYVLIGDPGQISPVITCNIDRWKSNPEGPHVACPKALISRHTNLMQLQLPYSHRLNADTVSIIQPAFYPQHPFQGMRSGWERRIELNSQNTQHLDNLLSQATQGNSLVFVELPRQSVSEVDRGLVETLVNTIVRLFELGCTVYDGEGSRQLHPSRVGVVCAHVSQVSAIQEILPTDLGDIYVETSERFQGLEKDIMFVYHPLSGREALSEFHIDAGRLCVMLSRHRNTCFIFGREGLENKLRQYVPSSSAPLGIEFDSEFKGWQTHCSILKSLRERQLIIKYSA